MAKKFVVPERVRTLHRPVLDLDAMTSTVGDATVRRVFAKPVVHDGVVVIPAARVRGAMGGGNGSGSGPVGDGNGGGGALALVAEPAGALIIRNGDVIWKPIVNRDRAVVLGAGIAAIGLFTLRAFVRGMSKRRR